VIEASYAALAVAAACFAFRMLRGPSLVDRVIGLDGMLVAGVSAIAVRAMETGSGAFLPVAVIVTLVGFISTSVIARFVEGQGG
jgi:multisubunit Na+/H+ antiporter MnhF subunit